MADDKYITGSPLPYNASTQDKMIKDINRVLIDPLMKETAQEMNLLFDEFAAGLLLYPALNSKSRTTLSKIEKKYGIIFKRQAEKIAKKYIKETQNYSKVGVKRNIKLLSFSKTNVVQENKGNIETIYNTSDNALKSMIIGMGAFYLDKVRKQTDQAVLAKSKEGIREYLDYQVGVTHRKTKNDAKQQYRQIYNAFNREYLQNNGIEHWQWVHTGRAHEPNKYHLNGLNGLIFSYDSPPPVIDQRTGTTGYPGDWFGCQCIMLPVWRAL